MEERIIAHSMYIAMVLVSLAVVFFIRFLYLIKRETDTITGISKNFTLFLTSALFLILSINFAIHSEIKDTSALIQKVAALCALYLLVLLWIHLKRKQYGKGGGGGEER